MYPRCRKTDMPKQLPISWMKSRILEYSLLAVAIAENPWMSSFSTRDNVVRSVRSCVRERLKDKGKKRQNRGL